MGGTVVFKGQAELSAALMKKANLEEVKKTVRDNGVRLQRGIVSNANFVKGYQTGTTKRSISLSILDAGFTAKSGAKTEYSKYLETGTRFMEAQPFVKPAFNTVKAQFIADLQKLTR